MVIALWLLIAGFLLSPRVLLGLLFLGAGVLVGFSGLRRMVRRPRYRRSTCALDSAPQAMGLAGDCTRVGFTRRDHAEFPGAPGTTSCRMDSGSHFLRWPNRGGCPRQCRGSFAARAYQS